MGYTPGPWKIEKIKGIDNKLSITSYHSNNWWPIAEVCTSWADRKLIVSAPDLLENLKHLIKATKENHGKFNVKKDYSLMIALRYAENAVLMAEGKLDE